MCAIRSARLAAQGKQSPVLLAGARPAPDGERGREFSRPSHGRGARRSRTARYLLVAQGCDHRMISDRGPEDLSPGAAAGLACSVVRVTSCSAPHGCGVMASACGRSRLASGDEKIHDLSADGVVSPEFFAGVRDELLARPIAEGGEDAGRSTHYVFEIRAGTRAPDCRLQARQQRQCRDRSFRGPGSCARAPTVKTVW